jgi:hypothetical protein
MRTVRLRRRTGVLGALAVAGALLLAAVVAGFARGLPSAVAAETDFLPPPDWLIHGNQPGATEYGVVEPLNAVFSARSEVDPLAYLRAVGWGACRTSLLQARVQPGGPYLDQPVEWRHLGCLEAALGGTHLRAWRQAVPGGSAVFLAVSREHVCRSAKSPAPLHLWHCIDADGYDRARAEFMAQLQRLSSLHYRLREITVEERALYSPGRSTDVGAGESADHIPYDGRVAILTLHA